MKLFKSLFGIALVCAAMAASAQVTPTNVKNALTNTITCFTTTTNLVGSQLITNTIGQGRHLGIGYVYTGGDATNTGVFALRFKVKYGGTNNAVSTTFPAGCTLTDTANGTTAVNGWQVIPEYTLGPVDGIILATITNGVSNVSGAAAGCGKLSSVWLEWRN